MMITFNDNEKKLKDDLNRDIALPAVVHERINTAYRMIEEHTVKQKKRPVIPTMFLQTCTTFPIISVDSSAQISPRLIGPNAARRTGSSMEVPSTTLSNALIS